MDELRLTDDIKGQIFGFDGTVLSRTGSEFTLDAVTAGDQFGPTLTGLAGGGFVATWVDDNPIASDDSTYSVRGQVFDATGHASSLSANSSPILQPPSSKPRSP